MNYTMPAALDKDKARAIARDMLDRLEQRAYQSGGYLQSDKLADLADAVPDDEQAQKHVEQLEAICQVCLLGSALLSKIKLYNECTLGYLGRYMDRIYLVGYRQRLSYGPVRNQLEPIFGKHQLALLEAFFEGRIMNHAFGSGRADHPILDALRGAAVAGRDVGVAAGRATVRVALENFLANDCRLVVEPVAWDDPRAVDIGYEGIEPLEPITVSDHG